MVNLFNSVPDAVRAGFVFGADIPIIPLDVVTEIGERAGPESLSYGTDRSSRSWTETEDCRGRAFLRPNKVAIARAFRFYLPGKSLMKQ